MGIKNLRKFLKNAAPSGINTVNFFTEFKNKKVCIDLNSYLYKMVYNMEAKGKNYYLKGFTQIIVDLLSNGITPIFIFDGKAPTEKKELLRKRANDKHAARQEFNALKAQLSEDGNTMDNDDKQEIINAMDILKKQFVTNWLLCTGKSSTFSVFSQDEIRIAIKRI